LSEAFGGGVLYVLALKYAGESIAVSVVTLSLLISFVFSPMIGYLIDIQLLRPKIISLTYLISASLMPAFLFSEIFNENFSIPLYLNIIFLGLFSMPSGAYLGYISSMLIRSRPASGFSLAAAVNTLASIIGGVSAAGVISASQTLEIWVWLKIILTVFTSSLLFASLSRYERLRRHERQDLKDQELSPRSPSAQIKATSIILKLRGVMVTNDSKEILRSQIPRQSLSLSLVRRSLALARLNSGWEPKIFLLTVSLFLLTAARSFFFINVTFQIFEILQNDVFLYIAVSNVAAVTAFLAFPIAGVISDKIGAWKFLEIGILLLPIYLASFLLASGNYAPTILIVLWALPVSLIIEVSQLGLVVETAPRNRAIAMGIIGSGSSLGNMLGTFLLGLVLKSSFLPVLLWISVFVPILSGFFIIPLRRKESTTFAN